MKASKFWWCFCLWLWFCSMGQKDSDRCVDRAEDEDEDKEKRIGEIYPRISSYAITTVLMTIRGTGR